MIDCKVNISIVSHGQSRLIKGLLRDLDSLADKNFYVIITENIPDDSAAYEGCGFPVKLIKNATPKGFGANHNAAFLSSDSDIFIILNPDVRLGEFQLNSFIQEFNRLGASIAAPLVLSATGSVEDSARFFPTPLSLIKRKFFKYVKPDYEFGNEPLMVDWVAGMFMCVKSRDFESIQGFDEKRFFMYFEDVDLCKRMHERNACVALIPNFKIIHDAQRASRKNIKYFKWHLMSALRYFIKI